MDRELAKDEDKTIRGLDLMLPRFFRCLPDAPSAIFSNARSVQWLPGFQCIPGTVPMSAVGGILNGVYPMDAASGVVVRVLMHVGFPNDRVESVLDLCCCPGSKFQMISEEPSLALAVGVDASVRRLDVCRSILQKCLTHKTGLVDVKFHSRQLLFHGDGQQFDLLDPSMSGILVYDSLVMRQEMSERCDQGGRMRFNKSARAREMKRLKTSLSEPVMPSDFFDRVLVDAECTHNGSYRHMLHVQQQEGESYVMKPHAHDLFVDEDRRNKLPQLQRNLALNGFRHLKPGSGRMVYSTCSLDSDQNELVVQWLLDTEPTCEIVDPSEVVNILSTGGECTSTMSEEDAQRCRSVLQMTDSELGELYRELFNSDVELKRLSELMCTFVAEQTRCPLKDGNIPGTFLLSRHGGTSGMFFAVVRKRVQA